MPAGTFTWGSSMPNTGALKNSKVSRKLFYAAIAETIAMQFVDSEPFGTGMGQSVTIPRIGGLAEATDYSLSENERIPEAPHAVTGKVITVQEFGRAIPWTRFAEDLSVFDLRSTIQKRLRDDMKLQMDGRAFRAFKQAMVKYVPTSASAATVTTNGTPGGAAGANLNVYHIGAIRDLLYGTYKAPKYDGSNYIGLCSFFALRGVKNDPDWEQWHQYLHPEAKYNSEVGRIEQVRIIETNHGSTAVGLPGLNSGVGSGGVLGECVFFGDDAVTCIESLEPTIVPGQPDDYQRIRSVAWYGQFECSIIYDTANAGEVRVVHVTST